MPNVKRIESDDQKHKQAEEADEQLSDEASPLGSAPEESKDIDETLKSVGLPSDEEGPRELNSKQALDEADKHQK